VRKDGTHFWANVVITPLRNRVGEIIGFAKVTRDLTSRREAEENEWKLGREKLGRQAAELERQRVLRLLEQVPATVNFLRGPELRFDFVHPKASVDWDRPVRNGTLLSDVLPEDHRYVRGVRQAYETGRPHTQVEAQEVQLVQGGTRERYWNATYVPVLGSDAEQVEGVLTFELDVTDYVHARDALQSVSEENARARTELENLNRAKDEFLATLSHELRTPLNAIYGWATLLRKRPTDYSKIEHGLEVIERNARAQTRLVNDLLDVSRIVSGKLQLRMRKTELSRLIHEAADVVRPGAEAKGVRVVVDIDPELGTTIADRDRLHQVLWNILINAVRFTERGGRITITADRADATLMIAIRDTGAGIDAAHLPHIFERFRQVDGSITRAHGGLGLGLAIVRHLIEAHGGTVDADSPGVGHGTIFTIKLPIVTAARGDAADVENQQGAPSGLTERLLPDEPHGLQGVSVLVVDDDPDSLEIIREVLEQAGATVVTATAATEALAALESSRFEIIISDIAMPEMDGYAFLKSVRASARDERTPAIALTAYARTADVEAARTAGYDAHLSKPIDQAALIAQAATLVARGRAPVHG
jgi:signal transduction histidine kinase/ActR/RegA family two-component response regulator